ncbi:MAG TPA: hypothetical protein VFR99_06360 [Marmoricola sp.]|nr:hypothetical protein [Marmoricola sp.]
MVPVDRLLDRGVVLLEQHRSTLEQLDVALDAAALELPDDLLGRLDEPV